MVFTPKNLKAGSQDEAEKLVYDAMTKALQVKQVVEAVALFTTSDYPVMGHRVLDDQFAVKALLNRMPDYLRATIKAQELTTYHLVKIMNKVLRRRMIDLDRV